MERPASSGSSASRSAATVRGARRRTARTRGGRAAGRCAARRVAAYGGRVGRGGGCQHTRAVADQVGEERGVGTGQRVAPGQRHVPRPPAATAGGEQQIQRPARSGRHRRRVRRDPGRPATVRGARRPVTTAPAPDTGPAGRATARPTTVHSRALPGLRRPSPREGEAPAPSAARPPSGQRPMARAGVRPCRSSPSVACGCSSPLAFDGLRRKPVPPVRPVPVCRLFAQQCQGGGPMARCRMPFACCSGRCCSPCSALRMIRPPVRAGTAHCMYINR